MSGYPVCQITSGPDEGNTVYIDLNNLPGGIFLDATGVSFGDPQFTSTPYQMIEGTRQITLPINITGTSGQISQRVSQLSRVLARPLTWLYWQTNSDTTPIWFRLERDQVGALDFSSVPMITANNTNGVWKWPLTLTAHSFAYGARITLPSFTVNSGTGANYTFSSKLPDIKGDVPAYCSVDIKWNYGSGAMKGFETLINIAACDPNSAFAGAPQWNLNGFSVGNNASVQAVPSGLTAYSGSTVVGITNNVFDGQSPQTIITGNAPVNTAWGQFEAYVRVMRSGTDGAAHVQVGSVNIDGSTDMYQNSAVWNPASGSCASWLDCGQLSYPNGLDMSQMGTTGGVAIGAPFALAFSGGGHGSTTTTYLDQVVLVPNHIAGGGTTTTMKLRWQGGSYPGSSIHAKIDGDYGRTGLCDDSGQWEYALSPMITGGWPQLHPGYTNWFTTLANTASTGIESASGSATVTISYCPRYLGVGVA